MPVECEKSNMMSPKLTGRHKGVITHCLPQDRRFELLDSLGEQQELTYLPLGDSQKTKVTLLSLAAEWTM